MDRPPYMKPDGVREWSEGEEGLDDDNDTAEHYSTSYYSSSSEEEEVEERTKSGKK